MSHLSLRAWPRFMPFVMLALFLNACGGAAATHTPAPTAMAEPTAAPLITQAPTAAGPPLSVTKPPQSQAAAIRPPERRAELTRLTNLLGFQALDLNGTTLGTVVDYIVNTCETYIIYLLINPAPALAITTGQQLVVPFEVVTINSGALDAAAQAIAFAVPAAQFGAAPAFPAAFALLPSHWEAGVRDYWQQLTRIGKLSTACGVPNGPIYKIAYATHLLGAELKDGNHNLLGTVAEAILEPESGKIGFFVVQAADQAGLVLIPLGAVNIPQTALEPGQKIELVLLAEPATFQNAPRVNSLEAATEATAQHTARAYWSR